MKRKLSPFEFEQSLTCLTDAFSSRRAPILSYYNSSVAQRFTSLYTYLMRVFLLLKLGSSKTNLDLHKT